MVRISKLKLHRTISDIMTKGNLDTLTTKRIRQLCEQKYNMDLTDRKDEIDNIVLAFVKKKSKEDERRASNQNNNDMQSSGDSDSGDESEDKSGDDEESSCSGSESCSNSECSSSESSDDESNKKVLAKDISKKNTSKNSASSNQTVAVASTSKQASAVPSTSGTAKKPMKPIVAPPKKRMTSQMKAAAVPSKKPNVSNTTNNVKSANNSAAASSRTNNKTEMDDAAYARQLQAEEWNFRRGTINKLIKNTSQKKTNKSDQTKKKKACPFLKKCLLSPALAEVLGATEMSRPDVVQKMWAVVRERNLFDPSNKQFILCDEQLGNIFGKKRVRLIGMMKHLKQHIKDIN